MGVKSLKNEEAEKMIKIRFCNVLEGFNKYKYVELFPKEDKEIKIVEEDFINTLEEFFDLNSNEDKLIIDFYKNKLDHDSIKFIYDNIDFHERQLFNDILNEGSSNSIFFEIRDKKYIKLLTKLCTRELFFITFYFTKGPILVWGNYNFKFPLFYNDEKNIKEYIDIAKSNNLF